MVWLRCCMLVSSSCFPEVDFPVWSAHCLLHRSEDLKAGCFIKEIETEERSQRRRNIIRLRTAFVFESIGFCASP